MLRVGSEQKALSDVVGMKEDLDAVDPIGVVAVVGEGD